MWIHVDNISRYLTTKSQKSTSIGWHPKKGIHQIWGNERERTHDKGDGGGEGDEEDDAAGDAGQHERPASEAQREEDGGAAHETVGQAGAQQRQLGLRLVQTRRLEDARRVVKHLHGP